MATDDRLNGRQLHIEDYLRIIPAEQGKETGVPDYRRIADDDSISRYFQPDNLLEIILRTDNLNKAYLKVKKNKGKGGIDGMQVDELLPYLRENQSILAQQLRDGKYKPNPVRRVEIPKEEKGKVRKLGIPTVVDRVIQQATAQELTPIYEKQFSDNAGGRRLCVCSKYGFSVIFRYREPQQAHRGAVADYQGRARHIADTQIPECRGHGRRRIPRNRRRCATRRTTESITRKHNVKRVG